MTPCKGLGMQAVYESIPSLLNDIELS